MSSKLNLRPIQQEALDWYREANSKCLPTAIQILAPTFGDLESSCVESLNLDRIGMRRLRQIANKLVVSVAEIVSETADHLERIEEGEAT